MTSMTTQWPDALEHHTMPEFTDAQIESEIQAKKLTAPRVTMAEIEDAIVSEWFFTAADGIYGAGNGVARERPGVTSRLTFCVLVLRNGYTVTGESACVSAENFDAELGRKIARQHAIDKCWPLFGFHLASSLFERCELKAFITALRGNFLSIE